MTEITLTVKNKYIVVPVNMNSKRKRIFLYDGEKLVFDFDACVDFDNPGFYTYVNVERFRGMTLTFRSEPLMDLRFSLVDFIPTAGIYNEEYRPKVHFTSKIGWINDPNGLNYYNGRYHMFFQHNPADSAWGNMTWGHAISDDLIHWHEEDSALTPDSLGTMFSGSAITDINNVSGLKENENDVMMLFYTAAGGNSALSAGKPSVQCMAYSTDRGATFKKYEGNPVILHIAGGNRDPKVVWCKEQGCYLLALYLDGDTYALFRSDDLLRFTEQQRLSLPGDGECPDIYPVKVENEPGVQKWVFMGASDKYLVGDFEKKQGGAFKPSQNVRSYTYGRRTTYAAQSFSGTGERRVRIAWDVLHAPGSVFENQMGIPCELSLVKIRGEYRLRSLPVKEFETLRVNREVRQVQGGKLVRPLHRKAYDIEITAPKDSPAFNINFFGYDFRVDPAENTFSYDDVVMPLSYTGSGVKIRLISDVLGCEIFLDDGLIYSVAGSLADYAIRFFTISGKDGGDLSGTLVTVNTLKGIW